MKFLQMPREKFLELAKAEAECDSIMCGVPIVWTWCNGCRYLDPQEEDQTPEKEPHMCRYWKIPLYHRGQGRLIPMPDGEECKHYEETPSNEEE